MVDENGSELEDKNGDYPSTAGWLTEQLNFSKERAEEIPEWSGLRGIEWGFEDD